MTTTVEKVPRPRVHGGKGSTQRRAESEQMLVDQIRGMRISELCEKYGVSHATVARRLKAALDERMPVAVNARREQLNASLDEQLAEWQRNLDVGTRLATEAVGAGPINPDTGLATLDVGMLERGVKIRTEALAGIARVDERRAKLNGTDAPVKAEVEVTTVTPQEKELRELIEHAQRDQAAREATLLKEEEDA